MKNINLFVANAGGSLTKHGSMIQSAFDRASTILATTINAQNVDVICIDDPDMVIPETGVGGYTPSRYISYLYIDSTSDELTEDEIFNTLCHELYHARSYDGPGYGSTLFDSVIFEGLATAFEEEMSNGESFLARDLKGRKNTKELFAKVRAELDTKDFNHFRWFIYDESNELPRWAGYEIGFYIVGEYLKNTNKKASEIILEDLQNIERFADDALRGETLG